MNNSRVKKIICLSVILFCFSMVSFMNDITYARDNENPTLSANDSDLVCNEICRFYEGYDIKDFVVTNDYLFMAADYEGFLIFDLSNKEAPINVYQESFNGSAEIIVSDGNYLYLIVVGNYDLDESYLLIYEISDPAVPVKLSMTTLYYDSFREMIIDESSLFLIGGSKFFVIDITTLDNPVITFESTDPHAIGYTATIIDDFLLLQYQYGFHIFNITNPNSPVFIDYFVPKLFVTYNLFPYDLYVIGEYAYCSCYWGLAVVNVTNPLNITLINLISNDLASDNSDSILAVDSNYLIYTEYYSGVKIFDNTNITHPSPVGFYNDTNYRCKETIAIDDGYLYLVYDNLHIIDLSNVANPELVGYIGDNGFAYNVAIKDNFAYLADGYGGLKIVSLVNFANPTIVGKFTNCCVYDVEVVDNYAYLCCKNRGLVILDVADKTNPILLNEFPVFIIDSYSTYTFKEIFIKDQYAYVACEYRGLLMLDLANPLNPMPLWYYNDLFSSDWVYATDDVLYTSTFLYEMFYGPLHIINIKDKSNPVKLTEIDAHDRISAAAVVKKYTFFAWENTLRAMDMRDCLNPSNFSVTETKNEYSNSLCLAGQYVFVCGYYLEIFNANDPKNLISITSYIDANRYSYSHETMKDVKVLENYAVIAYGELGFMILQLPVFATGKIGFTSLQNCIIFVFVILNVAIRSKRKKNNHRLD